MEDAVMDLAEKIVSSYTRDRRIADVAAYLNISGKDVQKTLSLFGFSHSIKRNSNNLLPGQMLKPMFHVSELDFLKKYIH